MSYTTVAEFRELRGISSTSDDGLIEGLIARAQAMIESYTRRTFEGAATNRTFDASADVEGRMLLLDEDLASITSVTNGNGVAVASTEYVTKGAPIWAIVLKSNSSVYWRAATGGAAENAITVNGVWAYSATPPDDIVQATLMLAGYFYDQRLSVDARIAVIPGVSVEIPQGMPAAVKQLLEPYRRAF